jgi:hypothetical protein
MVGGQARNRRGTTTTIAENRHFSTESIWKIIASHGRNGAQVHGRRPSLLRQERH